MSKDASGPGTAPQPTRFGPSAGFALMEALAAALLASVALVGGYTAFAAASRRLQEGAARFEAVRRLADLAEGLRLGQPAEPVVQGSWRASVTPGGEVAGPRAWDVTVEWTEPRAPSRRAHVGVEVWP